MAVESVLKTKWIGKRIENYEEIASTNTEAKKLAEEGAVHGTVVTAEVQTAGRGRRGRHWISPKGQGIWCSLILKPAIEPGDGSMITLVAAIAVTKAIEQLTHVSPGIKWPNDIVMSGRKVCGILTEMSLAGEQVNYIIVGMGINVKKQEFPQELKQTATSLENELGEPISTEALFHKVLENFEYYYELFIQTMDLSFLQEEYHKYLVNKDNQIRVLDPKGAYEGVAIGINRRGELLVEKDKTLIKVNSGEVSVRGVYGYV